MQYALAASPNRPRWTGGSCRPLAFSGVSLIALLFTAIYPVWGRISVDNFSAHTSSRFQRAHGGKRREQAVGSAEQTYQCQPTRRYPSQTPDRTAPCRCRPHNMLPPGTRADPQHHQRGSWPAANAENSCRTELEFTASYSHKQGRKRGRTILALRRRQFPLGGIRWAMDHTSTRYRSALDMDLRFLGARILATFQQSKRHRWAAFFITALGNSKAPIT